MIKLLIIVGALAAASFAAAAQTFSRHTVDTATLPDLVPGKNACLEPNMLSTHVCEPVVALLRAIQPAPAGEKAVISTADVLQLAGRTTFETWSAGWLL